jgi:hypothetical protein
MIEVILTFLLICLLGFLCSDVGDHDETNDYKKF